MIQRAWTLPNGLLATTTHLPHLHSVSISVAVRVGRRDEDPDTGGISHFLEHMMFRGSQTLPSLTALAGAFEASGGTLEGETWRDHTLFSVTCHPSRLSTCLAALADMLFRPRLLGIEHEKPIVVEEILAERDARQNMIDPTDISRKHIWADSALGAPICGEVASVEAFTQQTLFDHHRRYYTPENMSIALAGAFSPENASLALETFFGWPTGESLKNEAPARRTEPLKTRKVSSTPSSFQNSDDAQLAIQLTFFACPQTHPLFMAQVVVASILDDGFTSRLPQALSGETGLIYDLESGLDCYDDVGLYDILFKVSKPRLMEAFDKLLGELTILVTEKVAPEEISRARERALFELDFRIDEPEALSRASASARLFDLEWRLDEERRALLEVDNNTLASAIQQIFLTRTPHLCVVGPGAEHIARELSRKVSNWYRELPKKAYQPTYSDIIRPSCPTPLGPSHAERFLEARLERSAASRNSMYTGEATAIEL